MSFTPFPALARATLAQDPLPVLDRLRDHLRAEDRTFEDRETELFVDTGIGFITLRAEADLLVVLLAAADGAKAFILRQILVHHLDQLAPGLAERLVWDGPLPQFTRPPTFRLARVVAVSRPGAGFVRLRLAGDLACMAVGGLHLRLLIPPPGRLPVWPGVDEAGRTVWPLGADKLHDPVYTVRDIAADGRWLEIDVFLHGKGRTCHWAPEALGAEVGLMGPGGGWFPDTRRLFMFGDETALPAIARILAQADGATTGRVVIEIGDDTMRQPLRHPAGIALDWRLRGAGAALADLAETAMEGLAVTDYLWFAAEKAAAGRVRSALRRRAILPRTQSYVAGYWEADCRQG